MANFLTIVCLGFLFISSIIYASTGTQFHGSDLTYLGMFAPPANDGYMGMPDLFGSTSSMSYRPDGDPSGGSDGYPGSLFLSSHGFVGEIRIPAPLKTTNPSSVPRAQQIQSSGGITGGTSAGSTDRFGGLAYIGPKGSQSTAKLYWGVYEYYNVDATDYPSIGMSEITLSSPSAKGAWHVGPSAPNLDSPYHGMKSGEYLIPIDQTWADQYTGGKSLLVGRGREAGCCGGSMGPVLLAIAPWLDGNPPANGANISTTPLMYFNCQTQHSSDTTWMRWRLMNDPDYSYYSPGDVWRGGAWVARGTKKALILGGRHGTLDMEDVSCPAAGSDGCHGGIGTTSAPFCYGEGGVECPYSNGIANTNSKGYHTGPYKPRLAFIDPDELAAVAQGIKNAWDVKAYDVYDPSPDWPWNTSGSRNNVWQGNGFIGGMAYDETNGLLYVAQGNGYCPGCADDVNAGGYPLIHVYQVSDGSLVEEPDVGSDDTGITASPNPFNSTTKIFVSGQWAAGSTKIEIYNIHGKLVQTLPAAGCQLPAGITWTATGQPSGLYLVRTVTGSRVLIKPITLMK